MAGQAAQSPFQLPVAPVAGFTPDQYQAFQQTRDQQGMAQPYYNQAQGLFTQSANPISGAQVNNYLNPYAGYVMGNLREQQGQQMNDLTGRVTQAAGGVGADRIGVAQGELARQQALANGQTLSGIYGSALSAAQQDAQRQQSAAYGIGNLGGAAQNAAMQGTQALYGQGSQQQQLEQAKLNAPYQNELARIAFPYQNAQYLAGITGSLAGGLGGTTTSNQQTTAPAPSMWSQILGGVTGGVGALGATGAFGSNGWMTGNSGGGGLSGGQAFNNSNMSSPYFGPLNADGGRINYADGGGVTGDASWMGINPTIPTIESKPIQVHQPEVKFSQPQQQQSGGTGLGDIAKIAMMFIQRGGRIPHHAYGGAVGTTPYQSYAQGGMSFEERAQPTIDALRSGDFDAQGKNGVTRRGILDFQKAGRYAIGGDIPENPFGVSAHALAVDYADPEPPASFNDRFVNAGNETIPYGQSGVGQTFNDRFAGATASPFSPPHIISFPPLSPPPPPPTSAVAATDDTPFRLDPAAMDRWRSETPVNTGSSPPVNADVVPEADNTPPNAYPAFGGSEAASRTAAENMKGMTGAKFDVPYNDLEPTKDISRGFAKSPWLALMNAGFGMMAGTSPFAGVNIGKGLQEGVKTLESQRKEGREEESVNQRAKQLALEADKHLRQYTQLTPAAAATIENQKKQRELEEQRIEASGWVKGAENLLTGDTTFFNPRTGESGKLTKDGKWLKGGFAPATAPASGSAPVAAEATTAPAPFGEPSLAPNLEPPKSDIAYMGKNTPLAQAATKELQTTIAAQTKVAQNIPALEQDIKGMQLAYKTLIKDADKDGFLQRLATLKGANFGDTLELAKKANALKTAAGEPPPFDPDKIAAAETINKIQKRMGMVFASQISPREALAGQMIGIESTPGLTNSPQGFQRLLSGFIANTESTKDEHAFFQKYLQKNGHTLGWRQAFEKQNPPERYVVKALIATLPENLQQGLPEAVKQLRSDPKKYKPIFDKFYSDTSDYFLRTQ